MKNYDDIIRSKRAQNNYKCEVCGIDVRTDDEQLAHIIINSKSNVCKYGEKIIHNANNLAYTCSKCNQSVIIPNSMTKRFREHLEMLKRNMLKRNIENENIK